MNPTSCPICGAPMQGVDEDNWRTFECGTSYNVASERTLEHYSCLWRVIERLQEWKEAVMHALTIDGDADSDNLQQTVQWIQDLRDEARQSANLAKALAGVKNE